jgi:hypothetical protein
LKLHRETPPGFIFDHFVGHLRFALAVLGEIFLNIEEIPARAILKQRIRIGMWCKITQIGIFQKIEFALSRPDRVLTSGKASSAKL